MISKWAKPVFEHARELNKPLLVFGHNQTPLCNEARERLHAARPTEFVVVDVQADQHRDVDLALRSFLQLANNGSSSWPFHVVLSPETFRPFACATSLGDRVPAFLAFAEDLWASKRDECLRIESEAVKMITNLGRPLEGEPNADIVADAEQQYASLASSMPRFIMGASIARFSAEVRQKLLLEISRSGIVDHLNGGVFRCALSRDWHLPVFQKEPDDQATLLLALCAQLRAEKSDELADFASGLVAQMKSVIEGSHTKVKALWTYTEFQDALKPDLGLLERDIAASFWGVNENGNINDELQESCHSVLGDLFAQNVLSLHGKADEVAKMFGVSSAKVAEVGETARRCLQRAQEPAEIPPVELSLEQRGLFLSALAQAAEFVPGARALASRLTDFPSVVPAAAVCSDFAMVIRGLLDYYQFVDSDERWLKLAQKWQMEQTSLFYKDGSFYYGLPSETVNGAEIRYVNPRFWEDGRVPNYQGVSAKNLIELGFTEMGARLRSVGLAKAQKSPLAYLSYLE